MYRGCLKRNLYHYKTLSRGIGYIDMEYMKMIFRNSGTMPSKPWKVINKEFNKTGLWGEVSVGNSSNGIITVTKPDNGDNGLYAVCVGEARRGVTPSSPFLASFCPMYGETNAFWEIKLADKPENAARHAYLKAREYLEETEALLAQSNKISNSQTRSYLEKLVDEAANQMRQGEKSIQAAGGLKESKAIYEWSRAARSFTRSQIRALTARDMITPPSTRPEDFNV